MGFQLRRHPEGCQECMAVESLLSIGQCSPQVMCKKQRLLKRPYPTYSSPSPKAKQIEVAPPTPPPSDAGSLTPPRFEDSSDSTDMVFPYPDKLKRSRLAWVCLRYVYLFIIFSSSVGDISVSIKINCI